MSKKYDEDIQKLLKTIYDDCMNEDTSVRERQIREWRRLKLIWEGFTRIYWSSTAHDWRIFDETVMNDVSDQAAYDKPVNVFKAYLESIIAALSVVVPPVKCYPDDAANTLDIATAKAGDKIAQLIYRHNDISLIWLHMLFVYCTEGMIAVHNYTDESNEYGTYEQEIEEDVTENFEVVTCSVCGNELSRIELDDKFDPKEEDVEAYDLSEDICPVCQKQMIPAKQTDSFTTKRIVDTKTLPKSRVKLEVFGGLYVKIPNYARDQKDCEYLIFSRERSYTAVMEEFEDLHGNKELAKTIKERAAPGAYDQYAEWGRLSPQYNGEYPTTVVTESHAWIRPSRFYCLKDLDDVKKLKKMFPFGVKVTCVNGIYAIACPEDLDDHWTLGKNPLADYLHFVPPGEGLVPIQEITNDLVSLTLQTIEHGISQAFADPSVLDFNEYAQNETTPGGIYPARAKSGKTLAEGFFEMRTATLSQEVMPFASQIQSYGQLVSGALPSLFGGQIQGSETASEYSMSRAQALQRQQNTWKMLTILWKRVFSKAIPSYIDCVKEDERYVKLTDDGNFVNELIHKAELEGKIGRIELEADEQLPMTFSQKRDMVEKLLTNMNPEIQKWIFAPENLPLIHDYLGLVDFYLPGEDDIIKQYDEIKLLLSSAPIASMMPMGAEQMDPNDPLTAQQMQPQEIPSVEIDPMIDNHQVEFEICRKWLISETGRYNKMTNEPGYKNVLLHAQQHFMEMQKALQAQQMQQVEQGDGANPEKPIKKSDAPIKEDGDVQTVH